MTKVQRLRRTIWLAASGLYWEVPYLKYGDSDL